MNMISLYLFCYEFTNEAKYEDVEHHCRKDHNVSYYSVRTFFTPFLKSTMQIDSDSNKNRK